MQKYISGLRRGLAAFLACLTMLTCAPLNLVTMASAKNTGPVPLADNEIQLTNIPDMHDGQVAGFGTHGLLHIMEATLPDGTKTVAFCNDHTKSLSRTANMWDVWKKSGPVTNDLQCAVLTFYYHQLDTGNWAFTGPWTTQDTKHNNQAHAEANAFVQACVWEFKKDSAKYQPLLSDGDYNAGIENKYGYSDASWQLLRSAGKAWKEAIKTIKGMSEGDIALMVKAESNPFSNDVDDYYASMVAGIISGYKAGIYPPMTFTEYSADGTGVQPMIVRVPDDGGGPDTGIWLKILKVDDEGNPLAGAEFEFSYTTMAGGNRKSLGKVTTGSDGWAYKQVSDSELAGITSITGWAKETKAPDGYDISPEEGSAEANTTDNGTHDTAADLYPGGLRDTEKPPDGDSDILMKIDSKTKQPVGVATFHFEGQSNPNEGKSAALIRDGASDVEELMSATSVQYAAGAFEMEVKGSTGFAPRDLEVTLADGSKGTLKAGTAFTIVAEEGENWKFKTSEANGSMEGTVASKWCMINLPDVIPSIEYDILNASSALYSVGDLPLDGITGQNLYGNLKVENKRLGRAEYIVPIMYPTAKKWAAVQAGLVAQGDGLIFYDAYRPFEVQQKVKAAVDAVENKPGYKELISNSAGWGKNWFISQKTSNHQRGVAADVGLKSARDSMPSRIHDLSINGVVYNHPSNNPPESDLKDSVKNNAGAMKLHTAAMNAGLKPLASEWWHFDDVETKNAVNGKNIGNFYVTECLSVAPENAETEAGTGSEAGGVPGGGAGGGGVTGPTPPTTGAGGGGGSALVGPGAANDGFYSEDWRTDENGLLHLQWTDPKGENYIPPGQYTVWEVSAPPGYTLNEHDQRHLVLNADGSYSGKLIFENDPLRKLKIRKVGMDGEPLAGAEFDIFRDGKLVTSMVTGEDGTFTYDGDGTGIPDGLYHVVETSPPPGHLLPFDNSQFVDVRAADFEDDATITLSFVNYKDPVIRFEKYKAGTTMGIAGAVIEVLIEGEVFGRVVTGPDGSVEITPDEYGKFIQKMGWSNRTSWTVSATEVIPPDGFLLGSDSTQVLELHQGEIMKKFIFEDVEYPKIKILKRDINHPETLLPGATFEVFIDGHSIGDYTTNSEGEILIDYENYKRFLGDERDSESYTDTTLFTVGVREVRAPEGYLIVDNSLHEKTLNRSQSVLTFEFDDMKYPEIWVRKLDTETKEKLYGMVFEMQIDGIDGVTLQCEITKEDVEKNDGWHKITYEEFERFLGDIGGDVLDTNDGYTINVTELHAPQFYNRDRQLGGIGSAGLTLSGQLSPNQNHIEFEFYDTHYRSLLVRKIDAETQWPLKGAEFTLKCISLENHDLNATQSGGWSGEVSRVGITNDEGWYLWENLPNGTYELTETHEPQGYHGIDDVDSIKRGYWTDTRKPGSRTITITSGSAADGSEPDAKDRVLEFTYANEPKSGIKIFKKDGVTGHSIEGARFRITPLAPLEQASWEEVTDANGLIEIESDLTQGTYMIEELEVPAPYHVDPTPQYVELDDRHNAYSVTFNNYADGMVYIRKIDSKTGLPVAGARFEISKADGTLLDDTLITGIDGYIDYGPLVPGESYVVTEIEAPPGYSISNPSVQTFTVPQNSSGWVKSLIFKDDPLGNLWLRKIDAETGQGLPGAVFEIRTGEGTIVRQNEITDQQGYIKVDGLQPGAYIVKETKAPDGYMLDSSDHHVVLKSGQSEIVLIENSKPGGLSIRKIDASTKQPLAGAIFQLYSINDTPIGPPVQTGNDGYARWADLEPGQYMVEELTAPDGYQRTTERKKFEVKEFKAITYEWPNAEEATITIYKRDGETLLPLAGAVFEIRDLNGGVVDTITTDIGGHATSKKLPLGFYQVVETKAPYGYQIVETKSDPIEVKAGSPVVLERENWSDKTIIIRKRDVNTQQPLQGAWFELQTIDGEILQDAICTDATGVAVTKQVEPGMYYLVETKAPEGYRIITEKILVEVESGKGKSVDIDNMPETIVQIYKTDAVSGDPIANVEFALKDKHGKVLEVLMTDISGWAYSQPLPAGDYCVTETQAAPGYVKDTEDHWIEVEEGKNFTLMLKNHPGEHITVTKVDGTEVTGQGAASRKPLPGAVFELQTDSTTGDCMYIGTYTTDEYGKFQVEGLAPGFYRLYERTAPDGYEGPDPDSVDAYTRICVKAGELNEFVIENVRLGTLVVLKTDKTDNKPIAGATFQLETVDGDFIGRKDTDTNGEIIWTNLKSGFYVVKEIIAPDNYDASNCPSQNVEIKAGKTTNITFRDEAYGSLVVILQDKQSGKYLEGGQFVITRLSDMVIIFDGKTDITGSIVVGNLKPGWYEVVQKYAPDGYTMIETVQKVEIRLGIQQTLYFVNEQGGLVIEKVDSQDTSKTLEGARFKVTRVADNNVIGEYVTDKSGVTLVSNLTPGYYMVEEVAAPLGYEIDNPQPQQVDVHGGLQGHVTFMDTARASITVNVVDKSTQQGLASCKVEVWLQNGEKVGEWTSDKTGMIETEKMTPGYYVLKLVSVVDGYKAVLSETTVELKAGVETTFKFECVASGNVNVSGKDEQGNLIAGVKFRVVTVTGTLVGEYVTGADGTYDLSGLAPGNYIIQWLSGPSGYEIISNTQNVTITANGATNIELVHRSLGDISIQVLNGTAGMAGCKVEIWLQNTNTLVQTVYTDATGVIKTDKLEPGTYVVKLLSWPDGFKPSITEQNITVTYNNTVTVKFDCESSGTLLVTSSSEGKALGGVKFEIRTTAGLVIGSYETDTNGNITIPNLEPGKYVLVEISAPGGVNTPEGNKHIDFEVKAGASVTLELTHISESNVNVKVIDKNTQTGVTGVTVEIWQQNGALVKVLTTDSTGVLNFGGLSNGFYVLKVIGDVSGFEVEQREITFEVKSGMDVNLTVNMISSGSLTVSSVDASGAPLAGVTFEIRDSVTQAVIGTYVTDSTGKYVVTGLKAGTYVVIETACPSGSNMDESTKTTQVQVTSGGSITVTLKHISDSEININVVDQKTLAGLQGVTIEIWQQNGSLINTFVSDATGSFNVGRLPDGYYVVKLVKCIEGYTATLTETVIEVKAGTKIDFTFQCVSDGILRIKSVDSAGAVVAGMMFSVTDINGTPIDQNNTFSTGTDGTYTFSSLNPGWYIVTETKAPDGFVINDATKEQRVEVKAGESIELTFTHSKVFGLQIRTTVQQTGATIGGATYKISSLEGLEVATVTSNEAGIAFSALQPGWYVVTPVTAPNGYTFVDSTPRNVEVKADGLTAVDFLVSQGSSIRIKVIDGTTSAPLYNVRIQLKNSAGVCIKEYFTNDQGYITLDQVITAGGYVVEMISAPDGYIVDTMPHSLDVANGATTEIVYKLYKEGGQIQVVVTSSDYNKTLDLQAGTPLQGAVFQIENPDTFQVVGTMISNAQGIAASSGLPIGRYTVKMVTAPAYYALNTTWNPEVRLKVNNDVVRVETQVKSANLGAKITQATNTTAKAGSTIRVDMTAANNTSDTRVDSFFVHVKVPTDAARIVSFNPGTWTHEVWYKISYKTTANDYRVLASNLNSGNNYTYDLSTQSLGLQAGEYVTDIRLEFGTVPAGFAVKTKSTYGLYVQGVPNGYKMLVRAEAGGLAQATTVGTNHVTIPDGFASPTGGGQAVMNGASSAWVTGTSICTVNVTNTGTLPKTGY